MKQVFEIWPEGVHLVIHGNDQVEIADVKLDSREVKSGDLYAAIKGLNVDGHRFIADAIENGAKAILCEIVPEKMYPEICYLQVENSAKALGEITKKFFDNPASQLSLVGVTGTNGKSTIVTLLYQLFRQLGYKVGLISTIEVIIHDQVIPATHTTPDNITLNRLLVQMVASGCDYVFMEVSSHSVVQERISAIQFAGGIFTNLTHDHLDYHGGFNEYLAAKKRFFDELEKSSFALVNVDQKHSKIMVQNTKASIETYGLFHPCSYRGKILSNDFSGLQMEIDGDHVHLRLVGKYNAYNIMAVYATARLLNQDHQETIRGLSRLGPAEGRFDLVKDIEGDKTAVIDYAHTPDALEKVLEAIRDVKSSSSKLITVVGAGGNRDKAKRPKMALIAASLSDQVILTSDNPRDEEPEAILEDMRSGLTTPDLENKTVSIIDRKQAIKMAWMLAKKGDVILIAGKGHEKYQEIKGQKLPFDDKAICLALIQREI